MPEVKLRFMSRCRGEPFGSRSLFRGSVLNGHVISHIVLSYCSFIIGVRQDEDIIKAKKFMPYDSPFVLTAFVCIPCGDQILYPHLLLLSIQDPTSQDG